MNSTTDIIATLAEDCWTINISICGMMLSVFTLLYSFILSKKDTLVDLSRGIKNGHDGPITKSQEQKTRGYILQLSEIANKSLLILLIAFILALLCHASIRLPKMLWLLKVQSMMIALTFLLITYMLYIAVEIYRRYRKDTNI